MGNEKYINRIFAQMKKRKKVLVAMSGGIDSTVTAMLLHKQGYEIIGITMKTWDYDSSHTTGKETGCCNLDSFQDARAVAVDFGFPHYILDIREEFTDAVVSNFVDEYLAGRTPNPCILCNTHIKWAALLKRADILDCDYIATGHYANIVHDGDNYFVTKAKDSHKDQSYVLWGLSQEVLSRTLLPIGNYTKPEIRQMAMDWGYQSLSKKQESYEICFVPDNDYRNFLKKKVPNLEKKLDGGKYVDTEGNILGEHNGYPFYTIGQRKGLDIALGHPAYVTEIDPDTNTVVLGEEKDLYGETMVVRDVNWMNDIGESTQEVEVKIRYGNDGTKAQIKKIENNQVLVNFLEPTKSIAPGQSAVFYRDSAVLGGGLIA